MRDHKSQIVFIVGPTAAGKSEIALEAAKRCGGEIISCDAMQIYREIRIASNRPSDAELQQVPHHLVSFLSATEEFDVFRFNQLARDSIEDVLNRKKLPVVVGGSGLYMTILLDGIFESGGRDMVLREQLSREAECFGTEYIYAKLINLDPESAEKIHSHDLRRIIRALEVIAVDKKPISHLQTQRSGLWGRYDISLYCITREREDLYNRINKRVDWMFKNGILEEMRNVGNLDLSRTASALIGIKEIKSYLNGEVSIEEAKENIKRNTRRYAKRQLTWFRKDERLRWLTVKDNDNILDVANIIIEDIKGDECETFK